jgi:hypothetical protein
MGALVRLSIIRLSPECAETSRANAIEGESMLTMHIRGAEEYDLASQKWAGSMLQDRLKCTREASNI